MLRLVLVVFACVNNGVHSLSCLPCQKEECIAPPACCTSGFYTLGICGCCEVCAKAQGEECGGPWGDAGSCAAGLRCFRECGEDEEYCRVLGLYNSVGVCVEERQAEWLMKRARAEQREAKLDLAQDSLRPAPLCGQPQWQWQ